jgi:hypothetical protein
VSGFGGSQEIGARLNPDSFYSLSSIIGAIWHLTGPNDLNVTIKFMVPKALFPDQTVLERMLLSNNNNAELWTQYDLEGNIVSEGDYWVITVTGVNKF